MTTSGATEYDFRVLQLADMKIREDVAAYTEQVASGVASDYAQYRDRCGFIRGMNEALVILQSVNKSFFEGRR